MLFRQKRCQPCPAGRACPFVRLVRTGEGKNFSCAVRYDCVSTFLGGKIDAIKPPSIYPFARLRFLAMGNAALIRNVLCPQSVSIFPPTAIILFIRRVRLPSSDCWSCILFHSLLATCSLLRPSGAVRVRPFVPLQLRSDRPTSEHTGVLREPPASTSGRCRLLTASRGSSERAANVRTYILHSNGRSLGSSSFSPTPDRA